jgi:hypothetical protein
MVCFFLPITFCHALIGQKDSRFCHTELKEEKNAFSTEKITEEIISSLIGDTASGQHDKTMDVQPVEAGLCSVLNTMPQALRGVFFS